MAQNTMEVGLYFPNIKKDFRYLYFDADTKVDNAHGSICMENDNVQDALSSFDSDHADTVFALYGYAPMDIRVFMNGKCVSYMKACYQETLWHVFFREHGGPWHGRFHHFLISLIEHRYRMENNNQKAA